MCTDRLHVWFEGIPFYVPATYIHQELSYNMGAIYGLLQRDLREVMKPTYLLGWDACRKLQGYFH